jgi:hypothetical protein
MSLVENSSSSAADSVAAPAVAAPAHRAPVQSRVSSVPVTTAGNNRSRVVRTPVLKGTEHHRNGHSMPKGTVAAADFFSDSDAS